MPKLLLPENFEKVIDGKTLQLVTLQNSRGTSCQLSNFGARIVSLFVQDGNGHFQDIVLGYDTIEEYLSAREKYFGATIGRTCNRISGATLKIAEKQYSLTRNHGKHHLHGGIHGFDDAIWRISSLRANSVRFEHVSDHLDEGYPGRVEATVSYELVDQDRLIISYAATTDQDTVVAMTHHSFFNLQGAGCPEIGHHRLQIFADKITEIASDQTLTGGFVTLDNTPLDFRAMKSIGQEIEAAHKQMHHAQGYDHNYVLLDDSTALSKSALVIEPKSGRSMELWTDQPCLQFYSGNFLNANIVGKGDRAYPKRSAFCLEPQWYPDSEAHADFPSAILKPGQLYQAKSEYRFSVVDVAL